MTEIMHLPIPSELPWRVDTDKTNGHGGFSVYCANGTLIASLYAMDSIKAGFGKDEDARSRCADGQPKTAANARLVVKAVNHHEELVAFVATIAEMTSEHGRITEKSLCGPGTTIKRAARELLAKVSQ